VRFDVHSPSRELATSVLVPNAFSAPMWVDDNDLVFTQGGEVRSVPMSGGDARVRSTYGMTELGDIRWLGISNGNFYFARYGQPGAIWKVSLGGGPVGLFANLGPDWGYQIEPPLVPSTEGLLLNGQLRVDNAADRQATILISGEGAVRELAYPEGSSSRPFLTPTGVVHIVDPPRDQILAYCAEDPVERVFLEDVARRGLGRFAGVAEEGRLVSLCHTGANVVPSGRGCGVYGDVTVRARARMLIGEQGAVSELWEAVGGRLPRPREDRPGQPVYTVSAPPEPGESGLRAATIRDLDLLVPACARAHETELGIDPLMRDADGFRWRTRAQIEEGRSWIWEQDGVILFKAEASAWTPEAVQLQQVWTDPGVRRAGNGERGLRDLVRLLLEQVPRVCLFVRAENEAAIGLYEKIGMEHVLNYRSVLL